MTDTVPFFMFSNKVSVFSDLSESSSRPHQGPQLNKLVYLGNRKLIYLEWARESHSPLRAYPQ